MCVIGGQSFIVLQKQFGWYMIQKIKQNQKVASVNPRTNTIEQDHHPLAVAWKELLLNSDLELRVLNAMHLIQE